MSDKDKFHAKMIDGEWYRKKRETDECTGCAFRQNSNGCTHPGNDDGATECTNGTIWIACDPPQPETPAVEECAGCRYWLERGADTAGDILGSCRRNPPQVYRDDYGDRFPLTWPHDWCGEWKP